MLASIATYLASIAICVFRNFQQNIAVRHTVSYLKVIDFYEIFVKKVFLNKIFKK